MTWTTLLDHAERCRPIVGSIQARTVGGYQVQLDSLLAFLPGSQARQPVTYGQPIELAILYLDSLLGLIVVSEIAVTSGQIWIVPREVN